jgi:hypothetical protein
VAAIAAVFFGAGWWLVIANREPVSGDVVASPGTGRLDLGPLTLEEERRRAVQAEYDSLTESERAALRFIAVQPATDSRIREHVEGKSLPWVPDIPSRLEKVLANRDYTTGKFFVMPEYQAAVTALLFPTGTPAVTVAPAAPPPTSPAAPAVLPPTPAVAPSRPTKEQVLDKLAQFLEEGQRIRALFIKERGSDTVQKEVDRWFSLSLAYIRENMGADYAARYRLAQPSGRGIHGFPIAKMPVVDGIDARLSHLSTFMGEVRQSR